MSGGEGACGLLRPRTHPAVALPVSSVKMAEPSQRTTAERIVDAVTAAILMMGLGLVVTAAARSLPGEESSGVATTLAWPDWLLTAMQWALIGIAALGLVGFVYGIRRGLAVERPERSGIWNRLFGYLFWIGVIYLIYLFVGSQNAGQPDDPTSITTPDPPSLFEPGSGWTAAWVTSALILLVTLAVVTRLGKTIRAADWEPGAANVVEIVDRGSDDPAPMAEPGSSDPRSRIVRAYAGFETEAVDRGLPRGASETARQHARRLAPALGPRSDDLQVLGQSYELARYADARISVDDAVGAERALNRLVEGWPR